jgi:NTE family protein
MLNRVVMLRRLGAEHLPLKGDARLFSQTDPTARAWGQADVSCSLQTARMSLLRSIGSSVLRLLALLSSMLLAAACSTAHYPVNPPLAAKPDASAYSVRHLDASENSDGLTVVMTISGGGYRAAALGYAVMEVLQETAFDWHGRRRNLFQEVDFISAVSGGSLTAAYYAMDPQGFFSNFRPRVLDFDLQGELLSKALSPRSLWLQTSPKFGRGDLLQEVLDEKIFADITFAELPRRRPMVYINATDMRSGTRFEFSQDQFDHLCSDLNRVPLARAVAASMAVPLLMSPVTLWNHRRDCPAAVQPVELPGMAARGNYVHLVDGGLADNTGIRGALDHLSDRGGLLHNNRVSGFRGVRKRVFIVVDAQADPAHPADESPNTPGLWRQMRSVIDVPINRYSESSLAQLEQSIADWKVARPSAGADDDDVQAQDFHVIALSVMAARSNEAAAVREMPTGLRIDTEQIETIRRFVRRELVASPAWNRLLGELRGAGRSETAPLEAGAL